ncbi:MAG: peptidyl-prolyl cis-trans isomerase [Pseudomonadales bacterium]|nr:peptidyl-prolyl cis-trans isomerase [Pseudomonadales bacterium]
MKHINTITWFFFFTVFLTGCDNSQLAAKVGDANISVEQLRAEIERQQLPLREEVISQVLQSMIDREAALIKADELALINSSEFQRKFKTLALEAVREQYQLDWQKELTVTDEELFADYQQNRDQYRVPEKRRIALIVFDFSDKAKSLEIANSVLQSLKEAATPDQLAQRFQAYAVKYSAHRASRYRGGDVGHVEQGERHQLWPDALLAAAFNLDQPGDFAEIIEAGEQVYLVKLNEIKPEKIRTFNEVKNAIRQRLLTQRFDELQKHSQNALRKNISITTYSQALAGMVNPEHKPLRNQQPPGPALN